MRNSRLNGAFPKELFNTSNSSSQNLVSKMYLSLLSGLDICYAGLMIIDIVLIFCCAGS